MKKYLTRTNIGYLLTALLTMPLIPSIYGKLTSHEEAVANLSSHNLGDWITIIGIGELIALVLFIIPNTMRLGAVLLSAYFGGAIMFHMAHPVAEATSFKAPALFLVAVWVIAWIRGMELVKM